MHAARLLMIVIGGLTPLLVSVAPPQLTAHEKARTVLSESFEDAARAIRTVGAAVVSGRQLHRLSRVELAPAALDDEIHVAYRQVVLARTTIDEATKAAPWEAWLQPRRVDWARHKELGKRLRRTIYDVRGVVFGGMDGILTTFALLAAAAADIVGVEPESFDRRAQLRGDFQGTTKPRWASERGAGR